MQLVSNIEKKARYNNLLFDPSVNVKLLEIFYRHYTRLGIRCVALKTYLLQLDVGAQSMKCEYRNTRSLPEECLDYWLSDS